MAELPAFATRSRTKHQRLISTPLQYKHIYQDVLSTLSIMQFSTILTLSFAFMALGATIPRDDEAQDVIQLFSEKNFTGDVYTGTFKLGPTCIPLPPDQFFQSGKALVANTYCTIYTNAGCQIVSTGDESVTFNDADTKGCRFFPFFLKSERTLLLPPWLSYAI